MTDGAQLAAGLAPRSDNAPADLQRRFSGLERLYGMKGARAVRSAHVAVARGVVERGKAVVDVAGAEVVEIDRKSVV